jgi:hypothetical protein
MSMAELLFSTAGRATSAVSALTALLLAQATVAWAQDDEAAKPPSGIPLKAVSDFDEIQDSKARSAALFAEAGKVLQHPRCLNCHPKGDSPTQRNDMTLHRPLVVRGAHGWGAGNAMTCVACHSWLSRPTGGSFDDIRWRVAPASMAWQGLTLPQICAQLKDRRGKSDTTKMLQHSAEDKVVGMVWKFGPASPPGTQKGFGELMKAWVATGSHCPSAGAARGKH